MDTFASLDDLITKLSIRTAESQDPPSPPDDRIRALRTRRNALTPLCRVPVDVLVQILNLLRFPADEEELDDTISDNGSEDVSAAWRKENADEDCGYEELMEHRRRDLSGDEDAYRDVPDNEEDDEDNWDNSHSDDVIDQDSDSDAKNVEDAGGAEEFPSHEYESLIPCLKYPKDLISIASTCCHIRAVALTSPSLWSSVFLPSPSDLVALWLERAQSYPLIFSFYDRQPRQEAISGYDVVKPAMRRARHIAVEMELPLTTELNANMIQTALDEPMPMLVSLEISSSNFDFSLTPRFLEGCARSLTSLVLSGVHLPRNAPDLVSLTHLDMAGVPGIYGLRDVLTFLSRLASLRSLAFTNLYVCRAHPGAVLPSVTLPHLECLKLSQHMIPLDVLSAALPVPRAQYELLSLRSYPDEREVGFAGARRRVFARVRSHADEADVCVFHDGFALYVQLEVHGAACARAVYVDRADDVEDVASNLAGVRRLRVRGGAAPALFKCAADHPAEALVDLEYLTIEGWAPGPLETEQLATWLAARAENALEAHPARVRVLDLRGCGAHSELEQVARNAHRLGLVGSLLRNGHELDCDADI
jgi:hypothetical protein